MAARNIAYDNNWPGPARLIILGLVILGIILWATLSLLSRTVGGMETVSRPLVNMSVAASGKVEVNLPTSGAPMPNCEELGFSDCEWEAKLQQSPDGKDRLIETTLKQDGEVVGRAQVLEIETVEYEELSSLHDMGHTKAWISHMKVARAYQGNGLGRSLWRASDTMIKTLVGPGQAIHIFVDQAGWGDAIMREVSQSSIVIAASDWWAYIVR